MIRERLLDGEPVLFAPERGERPNAFHGGSESATCPFCPGNEASTPPEVARVGDRDGWLARAFPNKYPATPHHEVVVESARHNDTFDRLPDAAAVLQLTIDRYAALTAQPEVRYVCVFKNQGAAAGASIDHIHSQIVATPFVPPRVEREGALFAQRAECPLCALVGAATKDPALVVRQSEHFVWLAPFGSALPYQQWLVPRRHQPEIATLTIGEVRDAAELLQASSRAMLTLRPDYNWLFMNFPHEAAGHCYIELFPRIATIAGFELGTGTFIEVVDPLAAAAYFRDAGSS